jgi:hypothetical protein
MGDTPQELVVRGLTIVDDQGRPRIRLGVDASGQVSIQITDHRGVPRVDLSFDEKEQAARIALNGANGLSDIAMGGSDSEGAAISLSHDGDRFNILAMVNSDRSPLLLLCDRDGNEIWSTPSGPSDSQ